MVPNVLEDHNALQSLQSVRNYSPNNKVLHPRRLESSAPPLWEPLILQYESLFRNVSKGSFNTLFCTNWCTIVIWKSGVHGTIKVALPIYGSMANALDRLYGVLWAGFVGEMYLFLFILQVKHGVIWVVIWRSRIIDTI